MKLAGGIAALALTGSVATAPLCAQAVIVRATGPDAARFPIGQVLAKGSMVDLQRGSVLGLIDKAGAWELRGIVKTKIGKRPAETSSRLRLIQELVKKRKRIKRLAAVAALTVDDPGEVRGGFTMRSAPAGAAAPRAAVKPAATPRATAREVAAPRVDSAWWQYPLGESGTFCLVEGQPFELARRAGPEQDVTLREDKGERVLTYRFGAEAEIGHAAPSDIPVADGRRYAVDAANGVKSTVRFLPIKAPNGPLDLAKSLAANGCTRQIEALSRETDTADVGTNPARP